MNELELKAFDEITDSLSSGYGRFDVSVGNDDVLIDITGTYEWYFKRDTDYYSGTGECTTTHALVEIKSCDIKGDAEFDINKVVNLIKDYMYNN